MIMLQATHFTAEAMRVRVRVRARVWCPCVCFGWDAREKATYKSIGSHPVQPQARPLLVGTQLHAQRPAAWTRGCAGGMVEGLGMPSKGLVSSARADVYSAKQHRNINMHNHGKHTTTLPTSTVGVTSRRSSACGR